MRANECVPRVYRMSEARSMKRGYRASRAAPVSECSGFQKLLAEDVEEKAQKALKYL